MKTIPLFLISIFMILSMVFGQKPDVSRAVKYSDVRYNLKLTLEKQAEMLKGEIEIRLNASAGGSSPVIVLDWQKIKGKEKLSTVSNVFLNGKSASNKDGAGLRYEETGRHLIFKDGVETGENIIKLGFTSPLGTDDSAVTRHFDKEDKSEYVYSLFNGSNAGTAFPVFAAPEIRAAISLTLVIPNGWQAVAATDLRQETQTTAKDSKKTERQLEFYETAPLSLSEFAFAAGDFSRLREEDFQQKKTLADQAGFNKKARLYARRSQTAKAEQMASEFFQISRRENPAPNIKRDMVLVPGLPVSRVEYRGLKFMREETAVPEKDTSPTEAGVSLALARWRAERYSDVRYKLNITLEKGAPLMKGEIEIRVKLTEDGAKNDLILDWRTTQFANDKDKPYADVFEINGTPVNGSGIDNRILFVAEHITIDDTLLKKGENVIKIKFASPVKTSGAAVTRYVDKEDGAEYVYSLFVPSDASTAFPVFDQPDLKARFQLGIRPPDRWKVVSNTDSYKARMDPMDWGAYNFEETKPISPYVFAFAAGEFEVFNERTNEAAISKISEEFKSNKSNDWLGYQKSVRAITGNRIYVRKSQAEKFKQHADEVFRLNRESVKYLEEWFDYKFPFPKYDLVLIPEFPFGGMEHAGATFLREDRIIFPTEPTKNDFITRANLIFHEAAHQWFGDTVTMKWFDDLWLKEGFAEFMAYKTLEKLMPEMNAWKVFYERNKQSAYLTDVTRGTTPIYQEIPNLSSAKSAYGNIVYRKAPSFLKQAEYYLGEKEFQTAVRAFLKKHEFANATWQDLVNEFEKFGDFDKDALKDWGEKWVTKPGLPIINLREENGSLKCDVIHNKRQCPYGQINISNYKDAWQMHTKILVIHDNGQKDIVDSRIAKQKPINELEAFPGTIVIPFNWKVEFVFVNYQDYGYGIFLLDEKSRRYVLENIQNEKDDFLRSMMWGSLWDAVRFYELAPEEYVRLVIKNINVEQDESTIQTLLGRVSTAMNYYLSEPPAVAGGLNANNRNAKKNPSATADGSDLQAALEKLLINKIETAPTVGQKITYFRALQSIGSSDATKRIFKDLLNGKSKLKDVELKTKDKFDLVTRLIILGDKDALEILAELEKQHTDDAAKRYAYAARAGIPTKENKAKYWNDFVNNKEISENWIESAFAVFNTPRHSDLTLPYLEKALAELPNLKRNRKIFFVNGWLGAFIGGQKSEEALNIVNKFLEKNPDLDRDLRLKILENADNLERAVKIRAKYGK